MKLFASAMICGTLLTSCKERETVDCNISGQHMHIYMNDEQVKKFFAGEYQTNGTYKWTKEYVETTTDIENIVDNDLCLISDNQDYLNQKIQNHPDTR